MPKTMSMKVYAFKELSKKVQEKLIDKHRYDDVNCFSWYDQDGLLDLSEDEIRDACITGEDYPGTLFTYDTSRLTFDLYERYIIFADLRLNTKCEEALRKFLQVPLSVWGRVYYSFTDIGGCSSTTITFEQNEQDKPLTEEDGRILSRAKGIFDAKVQEALKMMRSDYEYRTSDEFLAEELKSQEWTFFADGTKVTDGMLGRQRLSNAA